jgi:hypothetical protein
MFHETKNRLPGKSVSRAETVLAKSRDLGK